MAADEEFNLELVVISIDSVQTHRAWTERREGGAPVTMLGDMTGNMARMFGVLDTTTHTAYSSVFLVDMEGVVQAIKVTGKGGLGVGGVGDVLNLVRDSFTGDVETEDVDSCE